LEAIDEVRPRVTKRMTITRALKWHHRRTNDRRDDYYLPDNKGTFIINQQIEVELKVKG
jgi:hypothetical protein